MYIELESVKQAIYHVIEKPVLTREQCEYICDYVENSGEDGFRWEDAPWPIGDNDRLEYNPEFSKAKHKVGILPATPDFDELYALVREPLKELNDEYFHFDLVGMRAIQIHKFEVGDERPCATDLFLSAPKSGHRKLIMYLDLNDNFKGGKVYLKRGMNRSHFHPKKGRGIMIPAYQLYGVEPVTEGVSYKMAVWGCGERFQ